MNKADRMFAVLVVRTWDAADLLNRAFASFSYGYLFKALHPKEALVWSSTQRAVRYL